MLFRSSRTLRENLAITSPDLDEAALRDAARTACLEETIASFSKGYNTVVGERGVTLSGGQKQRAAIARMLTRQTPILIFDDSLSAVDTETDAKIRAALEKRFGSATIILISHRITTLSKADKVLVLDHGSVAQFGTPALAATFRVSRSSLLGMMTRGSFLLGTRLVGRRSDCSAS